MFLGIDPGATGGAAVIDHQGKYIAAWRWDTKSPVNSYNRLLYYRGSIIRVYLEIVRIFPRENKGFITQNQGLLKNAGIWWGWLTALGLPPDLISEVDPSTWQAACGLHHWQRKIKEHGPGPGCPHSPLTLARTLYPTAPLECKCDDGKAVALLLARLALEDYHKGIDRNQIKAQALGKKKLKKRAARARTPGLH